MYSQEEKNKMAMRNTTLDKFAKKYDCPDGQVSDGKGGCVSKKVQNLDEITVRPSKKQIKDYTTKTNAESDRLNRDSNEKGELHRMKTLKYPPSLWQLNEIKKYPADQLLDYGNPADKPNLSKISTSRANLEKAKRDNAYQNRVFDKDRKEWLDIGGYDDH
jgi:hypothetical protein